LIRVPVAVNERGTLRIAPDASARAKSNSFFGGAAEPIALSGTVDVDVIAFKAGYVSRADAAFDIIVFEMIYQATGFRFISGLFGVIRPGPTPSW